MPDQHRQGVPPTLNLFEAQAAASMVVPCPTCHAPAFKWCVYVSSSTGRTGQERRTWDQTHDARYAVGERALQAYMDREV
ncbi:hypothetical protein [Cellulomonas sp.]|uniref:zinc finger domain-containing protein n=1 Tax=Cellulomonas sp. TaxID=40001 RepID=UPI00258CF937|nr:hypothetical protein [Cellulomonas sp.]MCR6690056.1 hypothetical protein [Cellulomonas sp.]